MIKWRVNTFGLLILLSSILVFSDIGISDSEPNNTMEEAENIYLGQEVQGSLDSSSDENDYYKITLNSNDPVIMILKGPEIADYDLMVLDSNNSLLAESSGSDSDEIIVYTPAVTGFFYVQVWAYDGSGSYSLKVIEPKTAPKNSYQIRDAFNQDLIHVKITGVYIGMEEYFDLDNGEEVFFGECVQIGITSLTSSDIQIVIPAGQKLISADFDVENKVITKTYVFPLEALSNINYELYAMSTNMFKNVPSAYSTFNMGTLASGNLMKVVDVINSTNKQSTSGQIAVWMITDNAQSSDLQELGATTSEIEDAKQILSDAGLSPSSGDDSSDSDWGSYFEGYGTWICLTLIIVVVILIIVGSIGKRSSLKKRQEESTHYLAFESKQQPPSKPPMQPPLQPPPPPPPLPPPPPP